MLVNTQHESRLSAFLRTSRLRVFSFVIGNLNGLGNGNFNLGKFIGNFNGNG